ncbi:MAG: hypothetical protein A2679_00085 [Candidatus Sungbacteria bacterium RIFCSPHIGHO2_01_FULL_54_26]|uniref:Uncharacterized protein n=1 Tax=Candidatus Sungbacteria bacterium RIFCSPHIGHO2_02_FULL_53_17 TaxID=1802275 RepID=A0A1G2KVY5_9BACT|nr:MAG: hypothetical protein A2679_00085 [Candidatus Sungbacteria bacterium RIFCSPHIGHO2_01_FULL_54_26]OHA03605.1 MAG: hypothetical protein A3C92_01295 [Candidatus Sungbacteria bacterium RIFCSPHIGHO2_02_FULL_53_17]
MLDISATETFTRLYQKLPKRIQAKAASKTDTFRRNPFHPSLRTKKLEPHHEDVWSFWIDKNYRIKFRFLDTRQVHLLYVGDRKDIYR